MSKWGERQKKLGGVALSSEAYHAWLTAPHDLSGLISLINHAVSEQNTSLALRFADRAWRLAPTSTMLCQIAMSLHLQCGDARQALHIFRGVQPRAVGASLAALHIDSLRLCGEIGEAEKRLESYLGQFSVPPCGALADAANALIEQSAYHGWLGVTPDSKLIGRVRCSEQSDTIILSMSLADHQDETIMVPAVGGWSDDEAISNISAEHGMQFRSLGDDAGLIGSSINIPMHYGLVGTVRTDHRLITGSIRIPWLPEDHIPTLAMVRRDEEEPVALTPVVAEPGDYRFEIPVRKLDFLRQADVRFLVELPSGNRVDIAGSPMVLKPIKPYRSTKRTKIRARPVEGTAIVIPVYRGVEETSACIESVLWTTDEDQPIIVVNDASPDPDMRLMLDTYTDDPRIKLLNTHYNMGFPGAANMGMAAVPDHDVILLNADTRVFHGWAERLTAHATSEPDIATVTPLSNSGSIASYPGGKEALSDEHTARQLDILAAQMNSGRYEYVPTGVGFCMFIRRSCIDQIGGFDEKLFARGYGEENDFCMRAAAHGWKNAIAGDVYVFHHNGVSFGSERESLMQRNAAILSSRHPTYNDQIDTFHSKQPLMPMRRNLDMARLRKDKRPVVLLISLALDGGVGKHVEERVRQIEAHGFSALVLRPDMDSQYVRITGSERDQYPDLIFRFSEEDDRILFTELVQSLPVRNVEMHHFLGIDAEYIEQCLSLNVPVDIYLHDYSWYCPRLSLLGTQGVYCGEPGLASCKSCVRQAGSELHDKLTPDALRMRSSRWLSQARDVFAPCQDVITRYAVAFPDLSVKLVPWEENPPAFTSLSRFEATPHRVAILGAIGAQKGQAILLACARHAALHNLPLEFSLIGFAEDEEALIRTGKVFVTGRYAPEELPSILVREAPSAIFLPSVTPETWSYTLSEALTTGLPVIAFDIGAISERLGKIGGHHRLIPLDTSTPQINELLISISSGGGLPTEAANLVRAEAPLPALTPSLPPSSQAPGVSSMRDIDKGITSSAEFLSLSRGLYHFSAAPAGGASSPNPASLPALQVAIAPGQNHNDIECVSSPGAEHLWLCSGQDSVILKVNKDNARVVVILLTAPGLAPLQIDVRKLDGEQGAYAYEPSQLTQQQNLNGSPPSAMPGASLIRSQIVVHAEFVGDVIGMDQAWAGAPAGGRAIECLTITPIANIAQAMLEYMAVSSSGQETPWVDQGRPCGSRGMAMPLSGFAIRQKPQASARFLCEYSGKFSSGRIVGPLQNGEVCRSPMPNDRLEAIWFHIVDLAGHVAAAPARGRSGASGNPREAGSRFSLFREIQA